MKSLTYRGVAVMLLSALLQYTGTPFVDGQLEGFVEVVILLAGAVISLYGRYRVGDLTPFGSRKI